MITFPRTVRAARSLERGQPPVNTLDLRMDEKTIVWAQGLQHHNEDLIVPTPGGPPHTPEAAMPGLLVAVPPHADMLPGGYLVRQLPIDLHDPARQEWVFENPQQNVRYTLRVTEDRRVFRDALETPGSIVVYGGHARRGRGPTFGPTHYRFGEAWEEGIGPDSGVFRMGYPYVGVPIEEIVKTEKYSVRVLVASGSKPPIEDCEPFVARYLDVMVRRTIGQVDPRLADYAHLPLTTPIWTFWGWVGEEAPHRERYVVLEAGSANTPAAPDRMDLGSITPRASACIFISCRSAQAFRSVWERSLAARGIPLPPSIWIHGVGNLSSGPYFLYHLFTYPGIVGFQDDLAPWLRYARIHTNHWVALDAADGCPLEYAYVGP